MLVSWLAIRLSEGAIKSLDMATAKSSKDSDKAEEPELDSEDNWKVEYEQLSEDFRHLRNVGWQVAFAVLAADGVILVPVQSLLGSGLIGRLSSAFLLIVAGAFSVFMCIEVLYVFTYVSTI